MCERSRVPTCSLACSLALRPCSVARVCVPESVRPVCIELRPPSARAPRLTRAARSFARHYFLTHCHSDHTVGLKKTFSQGIIWCSEEAANLLRDDFGLHNTHVIRSLKLHETVAVTERLRVTALSANHSPDAVMFVFDYDDCDDYDGGTGITRRTVHTGDFRYTADMLEAADGLLLKRPVDRLYLDTTYLNPRYVFPSQERVIVELGNWMREQLLAERNTLFAFMSYHIGKERAFFGAAEYLNMKVYVQPKKLRVLRLLNLPERWMRLVVDDPREAKIHVGGRVNEDAVAEDVKKLGFVRGVIVRPTGWSFGKNSRSLVSSRVSAHGVVVASAPYSEHSSYEEIRECVKALKPKRVIPTVGIELVLRVRAPRLDPHSRFALRLFAR